MPKTADGEEFDYPKECDALASEGLVAKPAQLKKAVIRNLQKEHPNFKPPGTPKKVGGKMVYPAFRELA
jgi:hypothetical protein